jgi:hypothetical protein
MCLQYYMAPSLKVGNDERGMHRIRATATRYMETNASSLLSGSQQPTILVFRGTWKPMHHLCRVVRNNQQY